MNRKELEQLNWTLDLLLQEEKQNNNIACDVNDSKLKRETKLIVIGKIKELVTKG